MFRKTVLIAFVFAALSVSPAIASPIAEPSARVRLNDVDVNTDDGAALLFRRIERAARTVCGEHVARRYASTRSAFRRCTELTIVETIERIGSERLRMEFAVRYGHI
jgi:UrcA family protein